jgi:hypothetical protein
MQDKGNPMKGVKTMFDNKAAIVGKKASAVERLPIVPQIVLQPTMKEDPADIRDGIETWITRNANVILGA